MSETRLLDQPVMEILKDHRLTNRVLQAFSAAQGISYPDALQRFQDNIAGAGSAAATLKQGLRGADAEFVADTVRLLDRRDAVLDAMVTADSTLRRDRRGVVTLDQGDGSATADRAAALTDPAERVRRWDRACRVDPRYNGSNGRTVFDKQDLAGLQQGLDLVKTLEAWNAGSTADQKIRRTQMELDQAFKSAGQRHRELKQLEADLQNIKGIDSASQTRSLSASVNADVVKLLDQVEAGMKSLDAPDPAPRREQPTGPAPVEMRILDTPSVSDRKALEWERVQDRTRTKFLDDQARLGAAFHADESEPAGEPVHHDQHQRILDRMRELDRPESEYTCTFEEMLNDGSL